MGKQSTGTHVTESQIFNLDCACVKMPARLAQAQDSALSAVVSSGSTEANSSTSRRICYDSARVDHMCICICSYFAFAHGLSFCICIWVGLNLVTVREEAAEPGGTKCWGTCAAWRRSKFPTSRLSTPMVIPSAAMQRKNRTQHPNGQKWPCLIPT